MSSGLLNIVTRPLGGYLGDVTYRRFGTKGPKYLTLLCGLIMGSSVLAGGLYIQNHHAAPHTADCEFVFMVRLRVVLMSSSTVSTVMGIFAITAIFSEVGNGANFTLVPHCHPRNNASGFKKNLPTASR